MRTRLWPSVALASLAAAASIALLATSGYLISRAAQRPQILMLMVAIVAVRAFGIARAGLRYGERLSSHDMALRRLSMLRAHFFARLVPLLPGRERRRRSSDLLSRFVADVDTLQDLHLRVLLPAAVAPVVVLGAAFAAWLMLPAAGYTLLVSLAFAAVALPWWAATVARSAARRQAAERERLTGELTDAIDGAAELALYGASRERLDRLRRADARLARLARVDALAASASVTLAVALMGVALMAVLLVGVAAVHSGALAGVLLAALAFLALGAFESVAPLAAAGRRASACKTAQDRLDEVCEQRPAVCDPPAPRACPANPRSLTLADVSLSYPGRDGAVLDGVDLRVARGERVALVGPSGVGKTTLAELCVRLLDPDAGAVRLDGIDLRELAQEDLRGEVLLCEQDAHVFNTSVRENLLLAARDASEARLLDALEAVELRDWALALPDRLDTIVGENGGMLSGGQRRRLALARALLSDASFLVLDEPTAHLDAPLAKRVLASLLERAGERGVLVITHDSSQLDGFDRVLELRDARLRSYLQARDGVTRLTVRSDSPMLAPCPQTSTLSR